MSTRQTLLYRSLAGSYLLNRAPKDVIMKDCCGLQAQFAGYTRQSLMLRASDYTDDTWHSGLVKIWTMRHTMHMISEDELGMYIAAFGTTEPLRDGRWDLSAVEQTYWAEVLIEEVLSGNDTRDGLKQALAAKGADCNLLSRLFYGWGGLIKELCLRGRLVCRADRDKAYSVPKPYELWDKQAAMETLLRRYISAYGPVTIDDLRAFFGWKNADMGTALKNVLDSVNCTQIEKTRYYHTGSFACEKEPVPQCVLIPGFDQFILAYRDRSRFLDKAHVRKVTNISGIIMPSLLIRKRIRTRWKIEKDIFSVTPFEPLLPSDHSLIEHCVARKLRGRVTDIRYEPILQA